jgi:hypothetical protein
MIKNKNEININDIIINEKKHFKQKLKVIKITDKYLYTKSNNVNCVMPIDCYLNKPQFKIGANNE